MKVKAVSPKDFTDIKNLLEAGIPKKYILKITGRSSSTLSAIEKTSSYQEYRDLITERWNNFKARGRPNKANEPEIPVISIETRLTNIENCLNKLLEIFEAKEAKANVAFWKR